MHGLLSQGVKTLILPWWVSEAWQESPSSVHGSLKLRPRLNSAALSEIRAPFSPGIPLVETYPFTSSRWHHCSPFDSFPCSCNRHTPYRLNLLSRFPRFRPRCNARYSGFYTLSLSLFRLKNFPFFSRKCRELRGQGSKRSQLTRFETLTFLLSRKLDS